MQKEGLSWLKSKYSFSVSGANISKFSQLTKFYGVDLTIFTFSLICFAIRKCVINKNILLRKKPHRALGREKLKKIGWIDVLSFQYQLRLLLFLLMGLFSSLRLCMTGNKKYLPKTLGSLVSSYYSRSASSWVLTN